MNIKLLIAGLNLEHFFFEAAILALEEGQVLLSRIEIVFKLALYVPLVITLYDHCLGCVISFLVARSWGG